MSDGDSRTGSLPLTEWEDMAEWEKALLENRHITVKEDTPKLRSRFEADAHGTYAQARDLMLSKNQDYGPNSISGAPGGPMNGLQVRIHDKYERLANLIEKGNENHESIRDTLIDLANYALIGVMVVDGTWDA